MSLQRHAQCDRNGSQKRARGEKGDEEVQRKKEKEKEKARDREEGRERKRERKSSYACMGMYRKTEGAEKEKQSKKERRVGGAKRN